MSEAAVPFELDETQGMVLCVDKPLEWTSFDVVKKLRYAGKFKKIGHAGTLDPLATGLLVVCTGKKTKTISEIQDAEKEYVAEFTLGATTASFDLESEVISTEKAPAINGQQLEATIRSLTGPLEQVPPMFSAVMVNGKRAYQLARKGKEVELKAKPVIIKEFELLDFNYPVMQCRIVCTKGTYIRSLARDLGLALGTGCYLSALRRTRIGNLGVEDSWQLAKLAPALAQARAQAADADATQATPNKPGPA